MGIGEPFYQFHDSDSRTVVDVRTCSVYVCVFEFLLMV